MKILQRPGALQAPAPSRTHHIRRLVAAEFARRSTRKVRRATRGQTLLIFALTFTVLIGFMGLAIDTVRVYDQYARMQRAAEAGALAGVIYMPTNYTTNLTNPPGDNAVCRAWQEIYKNSFGPGCTAGSSIGTAYCPTPATSVEIAVCPVSGHAHELSVTISEPINVFFLGSLNVGPLLLTATATAAYLPPVEIGSDPTGTGGTGSWGTFGECGNSGTSASAACTGSGSRNWSGNINGPGELKEMGDPLVTCEEGPSTGVNDVAATTVPLPYTTYVGMPTNHPQNGNVPPACTNPDTSTVFTGATTAANTQTRAGYAYFVNMEYASAPAAVWVWNGPYNPVKPQSCNGRQSTGQTSYDIFYEYNCSGSTSSPYPSYPGTNCSGQNPYTCADTDPRMLFNVTYSIYQIDLANPTDNGTLVGMYQAYPLLPNGFVTGCSPSSYTLPASAALGTTLDQCVTSACVVNWCPIGNPGTAPINSTATTLWTPAVLLPGHNYRVMVTTSDYVDPTNFNLGWGGHSFSLKLCPSSGIDQTNVQTCTPPTSTVVTDPVAIGAWNLADTLFDFPGNGNGNGGSQTTEYPLGVINSTYYGRTIVVSVFDPGDLLGSNNGVSVYGVAPPIAGVTDPCLATSAQLTAAGYDPTVNGASFRFPSSTSTAVRTALFNNNIPAWEPSYKNDLLYNGLWVDEQITLPANYAGGAWTLCAVAPQTNDSDVLAIRMLALGQSPVHLVG